MSALKLVVFVGSARDNRVGTRVLTFLKTKLNETKHEISIFGTYQYCNICGRVLETFAIRFIRLFVDLLFFKIFFFYHVFRLSILSFTKL